LTLFLLCLALAVVGALGIYSTITNHQVAEKLVQDEAAVVIVGRINVKVFDSRLHVAQARLDHDPANLIKEGKTLTENNRETLKDLAELRQLSRDTANGQVVTAFADTVGNFVDAYLKPVEQALLAGDGERLNALVNSSNQHYNPIKQSRTTLMQAIEASTRAQRQESDAVYYMTLKLIAVVVVGGMLLALVVGGIVLRTISHDTSALLAGVQQIQSEHDLTRRLPSQGNDELAQIAQAV